VSSLISSPSTSGVSLTMSFEYGTLTPSAVTEAPATGTRTRFMPKKPVPMPIHSGCCVSAS